MQSGFGTGGGGGSGGSGVSEMQQFMVEGGCPSSSSTSIFSISTSNNNLHPHHHHNHHHHHHHPLQPPPHFSHFQPIPITQQLFHQAHPFQLFSHPHHPELGLDLESGPENSNSGAVQPGNGAPPPSFLTAAMSFKLGVNDNSSREDDGILHADDASDSHVHPWQREEESTIKEPFWRPLDIDYINNKRSSTNEKQQQQQQQQQQHLQESSSKYYKKTNKELNEQQGNINNGSNYKLFSELEAIYKPGNNNVLGGDAGGGGGGGGSSSANNQTGSGSALTGDENPLMTLVAPGPISEQRISTINQISDTSTGEEAAPMKKHIKGSGRRKRKRRQQQLSSLTAFFENMVKQLMDHQEGLHRKFLEVIEKRDQDRVVREETWRKEEAAKNSRETALRAQERDLASSREAAIISFLEKITGETLDLPTKSQFQSPKSYHHSQNEDNINAEHAYDPLDLSQEFMNSNCNSNSNVDVNNNQIHMNSSRWPKAEVHALIRVRSSLEMRFQEPGLKGPLWEEVSSIMASMGYCRSSKRCKEKWENINKYFRKTKESGKKRPVHSKTCPYFHQLDQLYSKSLNNNNNNNKLPPPPPTQAGDRKDNSELLDAIVLNNGHEGDVDHHHHQQQHDPEEQEDKEEEEEEEEEEDGGKHQHHEHLFESLDS